MNGEWVCAVEFAIDHGVSGNSDAFGSPSLEQLEVESSFPDVIIYCRQ